MRPFAIFSLLLLVALMTPSLVEAQARPITGKPVNGVPGRPGGAPGLPAPVTFVPTLMIEMRPSEKRPLLLKKAERNPYARRAPSQETVNDQGENVEELQIREQLTNLSVTGRSYGPNGYRVLLGDIILERGLMVPQLIPEQSESLRVLEVTDSGITLGWLDIETGEPTGKTMQMGYDLSPYVSFALQGQTEGENSIGPKSRVMGVMRPNDSMAPQISGVASTGEKKEDEQEDN